MRRLNENTVVLCKRNKSCCPTVEFDNTSSTIKIKDDFGGQVSLTKEEAEMLKDLLDDPESVK